MKGNGTNDETLEIVLEKPRACRWKDSGKYFRWSEEMIINDKGNILTLAVSNPSQKGKTLRIFLNR